MGLTLITLVFAVTFAAPLPGDRFSVDYPLSNLRTNTIEVPTHATAADLEWQAASWHSAAGHGWGQASEVFQLQQYNKEVNNALQMKESHLRTASHHDKNKHELNAFVLGVSLARATPPDSAEQYPAIYRSSKKVADAQSWNLNAKDAWDNVPLDKVDKTRVHQMKQTHSARATYHEANAIMHSSLAQKKDTTWAWPHFQEVKDHNEKSINEAKASIQEAEKLMPLKIIALNKS